MNQDSFNTDEIINYLEITPPFLMIDHVEKIVPGKSCYAIKKLKQEEQDNSDVLCWLAGLSNYNKCLICVLASCPGSLFVYYC